MKNKVLVPILMLTLFLTLAIPASPILAADYGIDLDVSVTPNEIHEGDTIQITATITNIGTVYDLYGAFAKIVYLGVFSELWPDPSNPQYSWNSSINDDNILNIGESWTWVFNRTAVESTKLTVVGLGYADLNGDGIPCDLARDGIEVPLVVLPPPPPPTVFEGLTPGYWKNHLESWVGYNPAENFNTIFGVGPNQTLLKALQTGGGGEIALCRHAAAAILSAAHPNIDYPLTVAEVIAAVQQAYINGDFDTVKDNLESYNELEGDIDS